MGLREQIEVKLAATFAPVSLLVQDDSAQHAGHSGARKGGETHFSVTIVSAAFAGKSRIEMHRMVNEALADAFRAGVHALAIRASAPQD